MTAKSSSVPNTIVSDAAISEQAYLNGLAQARASQRTLTGGSNGADVAQLQRALKELGYFSGNCDGAYGEATEAAVFRFQLANGLGLTREDTRVFLKYDRDYLYVAAIASDSNTSILNQGGAYDDCMEIFVMTPFNQNIYHWLLYSRGNAGYNYVDAEYGGIDNAPVTVPCKVTVK